MGKVRMTEALLETAEGLHRVGVLSDGTYEKITVRHLGSKAPLAAEPIRAPNKTSRGRPIGSFPPPLRRRCSPMRCMDCARLLAATQNPSPTLRPEVLLGALSPEEIRRAREEAHLSQTALAKYTNLTTGYISQLERGTKQPTGSTLALLNIFRRKGIEALL